jgi:hypothetical protein
MWKLCDEDFPGSKVCVLPDLLNSDQYPDTSGLGIEPTTKGWIYVPSNPNAIGLLEDYSSYEGNCRSFSWSSATQYGTVISVRSSANSLGVLPEKCDQSNKIACCIQNGQ